MEEAVILSAVRTPIGRYGGSLKDVRPDDLAALVIAEAVRRANIDAGSIEDVILGCANQAGEDNRNVARMALLLAGLPVEVAGQTVNRLCGSGLQAVNAAAHAMWSGQGDLFVTGGVESMTRAPLVMLKPDGAYPRGVPPMADSTLGWRFPHPELVTAGHSSGINDGAAALLVMSAERARSLGLQPLARIVSTAVAGVKPDEMGLGPIPASRKALARAGLSIDEMRIVELNEAFASQVIACLDDLGVDWRDEARVNPNGGAIAIGHPLCASGARLAVTATLQLRRTNEQYALVTMCIGVGQGIATILAGAS